MPVEQQVVVVEDVGGLLAVDVGIEEAAEVVGPLSAPGEVLVEHLLELLPGIDAAAVDGHAGALLGEAAVGLGQSQLGAQHVQEVFRVGAVVDGELRREADRLAVAAKEPGGDGVKGAAPDAGGGRAGSGGRAASRSSTAATRRSISAAARRVKVNRRMRPGSMPAAMSQATRWTSVAVLPVPAPATINKGPMPCRAASLC